MQETDIAARPDWMEVQRGKRVERSSTARPHWMGKRNAHENAASGSSSAADSDVKSQQPYQAGKSAWWKPERSSRWVVAIGLVVLGTLLLLLANLGAGSTVGAMGTLAVLLTVLPMRHLRWKLLAFVPAAYVVALICSFLFLPLFAMIGGEEESSQPAALNSSVVDSIERTPTPTSIAPEVTSSLGFETFGVLPWQEPPGAELFYIRNVVDGDTITVITGEDADEPGLGWEPVRLIGVDAPEQDGRFTEEECYGPEAFRFLAELLPEGTAVYLQIDNDVNIPDDQQTNEDSNGRWLRHVFLKAPDTESYYLVTEILALGGYVDVKYYNGENTYFHRELQDAENVAREENRGLWGACSS